MTCGCGCGTKFLRRSKRERKNGLYFLNSEHQGRYTTAKNLEKCCGPFRPTLDVYLEAIAARGYRSSSVKVARNNLAPFFLFLNREGIAALNDVTPATITRYLARSKEEGSNRTEHISAISVFFKWLISERRRTTGNPVVRLIHGRRKPHHLPPPLEPDELDFAWELLHERGSALLRFAAAVAEEAGLRVGEICRLRIQDVDIVQQRLFVGLPNKTNTERYAFFDEKTKRYYHEWMAERKADCDHDLVLHNRDGHPLQVDSLITAFRHAMCKVGPRGKATSDIGFDNWSTHRLRHTMASNLVSAGADLATVMAAGGWRSYAAMCGYARVDQEVAKRGYYAAMEAAKEASTLALSNRTLTPAEVLEKCNDLITPQVFSADPSERLRVMDCV
jgi:integrase/recombinase XerC